MNSAKQILHWCFGPRPLKSFRFWGLVLLVVYTLGGFFLAPWIIRGQLVTQIQENLGREASVGEVKVNPFMLSLAVSDFRIAEPDGEPWLGFDYLYVNFQASSLFRWAWTFAEVRLDQPRFAARVNEAGELNFADLMATEEDPVAPAGEPEEAGLPRLVLFQVSVSDGHLQFEDRSRPSAFEQDITPITFELSEFSTLPEAEGPYSLEMRLPGGARFRWQGSLAVAPLHSEGQIAFADAQLETGWRYIQDQVAFAFDSGTAAGETDYQFTLLEEGAHLTLEQLRIQLDAVHLLSRSRQERDIEIPRIELSGGHLDLREREFAAQRLALEQPVLRSTINADGEFELADLFLVDEAGEPAATGPTAAASADAGAAPPWRVGVAEISVTGLRGSIRNEKTEPAARNEFEDVNLTIADFSLEPEARFPLTLDLRVDQQGTLEVEGDFSIFPPTLDVAAELTDLPLAPYQPYLARMSRLSITGGAARFDGRVSLDPGNPGETVRVNGAAGVAGVGLEDAVSASELLSLEDLALQNVILGLPAGGLSVGQVDVTALVTTVQVAEDGRVNLMNALADAPDSGAPDEAAGDGGEDAPQTDAGRTSQSATAADEDVGEPGEQPFSVRVEKVTLANTEVRIVDESVDPRFRAGLTEIAGTISGLSSENLARADVDLTGAIDGYAQVAITGQINPLADDVYSDIKFTLSGYEMTSVTPYSGIYLGQKIDQGKLSLDLNYRLSQRELVGDNQIVLEQFGLGERVPSDEAIGLPVGLAVALLKDANGRIDIDVPVRGNLDDPDFRIGHLVFRAVFNLITGIVTSPFNLLGSLVGGSADQLDNVMFKPGLAELGESYQERVTTLADALGQRPQLRLEIRPAFNREADARAIRLTTLAQTLSLEPRDLAAPESTALLPVLLPHAGEVLGEEAVAALRTSHLAAAGGEEEEPMLDEAAFTKALLDRLMEPIEVADETLRELAQQRAEAVRGGLVEAGIDQGRIFVLEPAGAPVAPEGVKMEFTLTAE